MAGPQKRSDKLKRLVAVQRQVEAMTESELAATLKNRNEVGEAKQAVIEALGSMDPIHREFSRFHAERHGRLMARDRQLEAIQQVQETRLLKERTKADRLEEKMGAARMDEDREAEEETLQDLLELAFAARRAE